MAFHLPKKFSQVAQIIFFYEKSSKRTNESHTMQRNGQNMENIFLLIRRMAQEKQRRKTSKENTG